MQSDHQLDVPVTAMRNNLNYATGNLSAMNYNVGGCGVLHSDYVLALDAACKETLYDTFSFFYVITHTIFNVH